MLMFIRSQQSIRGQQGSFMLEALIGIMLFFLGVLTMIALQASSIAIQTDSQYRAEASNLVDQILGQINLNSRDNIGAVNAVTLAAFAHQPTGGVSTCRLVATDALAATDCCNFGGAASVNPLVTDWVASASTDIATRLPGSTAARQQIVVNTAAANQVIVTVCWQGPKDARPRFHRVIGYVN
jgi:type IV pilus assembly protein PilV